MIRRVIASARTSVLLVLALAAGAAEPRLADLRLIVEQRPTSASFSWQDAGGGADGTVDFTQALGLGIGARWGWGQPGMPWKLVAGVEAVMVRESFVGGERTASLLRLEAAYAHALTDDWLLVVGPVAGGGPSRTRLDGGAIRPLELDGTLREAGLRAGLRWSLSRRWSLAADAGWLAGVDHASGDGASLDWRRSGPWAGLELAFTLDPRARRLE